MFTQTTVADIKKEYRRLCNIHHPDKGGETAMMQEVNAQYHEALQNIDGAVTQDKNGTKHTYTYKFDVEEAIIDKIDELLSLNLTGIEISLIGTWIWITGETKVYKEQLKAAKCKWHAKRKCWFFSLQSKTRYNSKASLDDLASTYGYSTFNRKTNAICKG